MTGLSYHLPADLAEDIGIYEEEVARFLAKELPAPIFKARRVARGVYEQRQSGTYMVRVRVPGGSLTAQQRRELSEASCQFGNGLLHITTRQDVQLHDTAIQPTPAIMWRLMTVDAAVKRRSACEEAGVPFELVPGVSSALGEASCAGIPLTHRGVASSVAFVTAQHGGDDQVADRRLASLLESADTVVIFMGGSRIGPTVESLIASGIPGNLPMAVVSQATLPTQKTVLGTLDCIVERVRSAELATPMLIVLGAVTNLSPILNTCERPQPTIANVALPQYH